MGDGSGGGGGGSSGGGGGGGGEEEEEEEEEAEEEAVGQVEGQVPGGLRALRNFGSAAQDSVKFKITAVKRNCTHTENVLRKLPGTG